MIMQQRGIRQFNNDEKGTAIVEATILLPFCIVIIIALFYAAIFLCQKANLQANLQNTLIYYKNTYSDNYIDTQDTIHYSKEGNTYSGEGSRFGEIKYLFPYRAFIELFQKFDSSKFESFFRQMSGFMFFDDGSNITISPIDGNSYLKNYLIYKTISAKATQVLTPAISLEMIGLDSTIKIEVSGTVVISDGDEMIREIDLAVDLLEDTKAGEAAAKAVAKVSELYTKFKNTFDK